MDIITDGTDKAQSGFWGVVPGSPAAAIAASNSTDQTTVQGPTAGTAGFIAGTGSNADHLAFSAHAWGTGAGVLGLTDSAFAHIVGPVATVAVSPAQGAGTTVGAGQDLIITTDVASSAAQFATDLKTGFTLNFTTALAAGNTAHVLMAYNDSHGNAHIADVDLHATAASSTTASGMTIFASDMVTLTGVSDTALTSNNIHIVA